MGVNTKGIITTGTTIMQIKQALIEKYTDVEIHETSMDYYFLITLRKGEVRRTLSVFFGDLAFNDHGIKGVLIDLRANELAKQVIHYLVSRFGGYYLENDCSDKDFVPINTKLYKEGKQFSKMDLFRHEVIYKLGSKNLDIIMELFEKFKSLTN